MDRERGSVTMWMMVVLVLATVLATLIMKESTAAVEDGRAQGVADLVALAGVRGDRAQAAQVATRNGAALVRLDLDGDVTEAVIRLQGVTASAHATQGEATTEPNDPLDSISWPPTHQRWRQRPS